MKISTKKYIDETYFASLTEDILQDELVIGIKNKTDYNINLIQKEIDKRFAYLNKMQDTISEYKNSRVTKIDDTVMRKEGINNMLRIGGIYLYTFPNTKDTVYLLVTNFNNKIITGLMFNMALLFDCMFTINIKDKGIMNIVGNIYDKYSYGIRLYKGGEE